jgi:protein TonB
MSSATLSFRPRVHPDAVRIVALSAAISLNAAMLLLALRPIAGQLVLAVPDTAPMKLTFVDPPVLQPQPPQPELPPLHRTRTLPDVAPPLPQVTEPSRYRVPAPAVTPLPAQAPASDVAAPVADTPVAAPPAAITLAYVSAPAPAYPMQARRLRMQGTVILRVLVDGAGQPQQVVIERSSGHELLDRTASEQVLKHWRFRPAQVDGHAVRAWARVPVSFNLHRS